MRSSDALDVRGRVPRGARREAVGDACRRRQRELCGREQKGKETPDYAAHSRVNCRKTRGHTTIGTQAIYTHKAAS